MGIESPLARGLRRVSGWGTQSAAEGMALSSGGILEGRGVSAQG